MAGHLQSFQANRYLAIPPGWLPTHLPAKHLQWFLSLLQAGARLVGKTQTDELAWSLNGLNQHYGTPINPLTPERIPGGSSSGSVVAVAMNLADIGLGTDTGGSIRVPAVYNGLWGIRTTHNAISRAGLVPLAPSFDTLGWMTQDITTLRKVAQCLLPADASKCQQNAAYLPGLVQLLPEKLQKVFLSVMQNLHIPASNLAIDEAFIYQLSEVYRTLQAYEAHQSHGAWIETAKPVSAEDIAQRFALAKTLSAEDYALAQQKKHNSCRFLSLL